MSETVTIERSFHHRPEKVWRALTESALIEDWLMSNDFKAEVGHDFTFKADWGSVAGKVLEVSPPERLSYTWSAMGLESVVIFTLEPTAENGTLLRMEQEGFATDTDQNYRGAQMGWTRFLSSLATVLDGID